MPPPIGSHSDCSRAVAPASLGNHTSGTETTRPSDNVTCSASPEHSTSTASVSDLATKVLMPSLQEEICVLHDSRRHAESLLQRQRGAVFLYLEPITTIFVPQGWSSSGSVVLPRANVAPAQGAIFPLVVSHCCACFAVPLLATVVFSDNGWSPSLKKKYRSASFRRR